MLRGGKFSPWAISKRVYFACSPEFAVGNFAPTCCEPTFGWWWLLLLADALPLSFTGLLSLPDELLVSRGGLLFLLGGLLQNNSWWLAVDCWYFRVLLFSDALLLLDGNIFLFQLLWKGTTELCHLKMNSAVALRIGTIIGHDHATHRFHYTPAPNAQATARPEILLNFEAGIFRTAA